MKAHYDEIYKERLRELLKKTPLYDNPHRPIRGIFDLVYRQDVPHTQLKFQQTIINHRKRIQGSARFSHGFPLAALSRPKHFKFHLLSLGRLTEEILAVDESVFKIPDDTIRQHRCISGAAGLIKRRYAFIKN